MPQTDESTAPWCLTCALLQLGQAPRAEGRGPPYSAIARFWSLALGPWCSALRMASLLLPENLTHLQVFGAVKQSKVGFGRRDAPVLAVGAKVWANIGAKTHADRRGRWTSNGHRSYR